MGVWELQWQKGDTAWAAAQFREEANTLRWLERFFALGVAAYDGARSWAEATSILFRSAWAMWAQPKITQAITGAGLSSISQT